jgi:hygromycin-B 7''-O-kinase
LRASDFSPQISSDRLLPLEDHDSYCRLFMALELWEPFVRHVCAIHRLDCHAVRPGLAGTFPTFLVDDRWVVKFFGRHFNGGLSFRIEQELARLIQSEKGIPAAQVVGSGELFPADQGWRWPYLIFTQIPGASLGELYDLIAIEDRLKIATEMGGITRLLHQMSLQDSIVFKPDWSNYLSFLKRQRQVCVPKHAASGRIPHHLLDQIKAYLFPVEHWLDRLASPHLIHADLTRDHLLGNLVHGVWVTGGLIDFGDAMVGDIYYELAALHLDLFTADKRMLASFCKAYRMDPADNSFVHKAMTAALLHQFDVISPLFERYPKLKHYSSLEELASYLWDVNLPGIASNG